MMQSDLERALGVATEAARAAGEVLRADLHRRQGPRGAIDKADADTEAERVIRARLEREFPEWGYLGEETGARPAPPGVPVWLVDPNDGTRDYLQGRRGSAVSIALLADRLPRLGVVFAFAYPDDQGDLFAWAEGCGPLRRNGLAVAIEPPSELGSQHVVLVSSAGEDDIESNLGCTAPARVRCVPSIAHRLALVAAGEAAAAVSLHHPCAWDYGGGHALLRGAGASLVDEAGRDVVYADDGGSRCRFAFAGSAAVARSLAGADWSGVGRPGSGTRPAGFPVRLEPGRAVADSGLLSRAQGCLLGQVAGDSLGALVEFEPEAAIAGRFADGPRTLTDGGTWNLLAGQPTDDSEMALALARALLARGGFDANAVKAAYLDWLGSRPFDVGGTTAAGLRGAPRTESQANGALMRVSPLGVLLHAADPSEAAVAARADAVITHPHPVCGDASAAFVVALAHAIRHGDGGQAAWQAARSWAEQAGAHSLVIEALDEALESPPRCGGERQGWVRIALQNAFFELLHAGSLEEGVVATVRRGGDADTNAAIAGALLGAVHGRGAIPAQWRSMVLSCRSLPGSGRPRPAVYWPVDVLEIAERLLLAGQPAA